MRKIVIGQAYGRLTVIAKSTSKYECSYWECVCSCGNTAIVRGPSLGRSTLSCGCYAAERRRKHGHTKSGGYRTRTYITWEGMLGRCYNPNHPNYKNYGGRGIAVCERWRSSFENFFDDMGEKPKHLSLDRIDNNGSYCKENCRWATSSQQNRNRRSCRIEEYNGQSKTVTDWAETLGINTKRLFSLLQRNSFSAAVQKALYSK